MLYYESKMSQWKYLKHDNKGEYFNKLGKDISWTGKKKH